MQAEHLNHHTRMIFSLKSILLFLKFQIGSKFAVQGFSDLSFCIGFQKHVISILYILLSGRACSAKILDLGTYKEKWRKAVLCMLSWTQKKSVLIAAVVVAI